MAFYPSAPDPSQPGAPASPVADDRGSEQPRTERVARSASEPAERVSGRFAQGNRDSVGRRVGRPKGVAAVAREIQERIGYDAMVSYAESIWSGWEWDPDTRSIVYDREGRPVRAVVQPTSEEKYRAYQLLWDRGWGKPVVAIDMQAVLAMHPAADALEGSAAGMIAAAVDDGTLEGADLDALEGVLARVLGLAPAPTAHAYVPASAPETLPPIDVPAVVSEPVAAPLETSPAMPAAEPPPDPPAPPAPWIVREWQMYEFAHSTNVAGFVFDARSGLLLVRFAGTRGCYAYANVTPALVAEWTAAPSAGKWLAARLKPRADLFPCVVCPVGEYDEARARATPWVRP